MKYTLENDFLKHVKSPQLHRVYLLYGTQTYLIELYEKQLIKKALDGKFNDFNLHRFNADNYDPQEFFDAVESVPLFSGGRCVTLDIDPAQPSQSVFKELLQVLDNPPQTTTIIVTVKCAAPKKDRLDALVKTCGKAGAVMELTSRGSSDVLRFLRNRAQKNGCAMASDCAQYLMRRCTDDMQQLAIETDKLCAYVGTGNTVTKQDIDAVCCAHLQARVYDLSRSLLRGQFSNAMDITAQLLFEREAPTRILSVLGGAFVDMYRGAAASQAAVSPPQAAKELGYPGNRSFAISNAMKETRYRITELGNMLEVVAQTDAKMKMTGAKDRVLLEECITRLFAMLSAS